MRHLEGELRFRIILHAADTMPEAEWRARQARLLGFLAAIEMLLPSKASSTTHADDEAFDQTD